MDRISRDHMMIQIALTVAQRSTCMRKKVGAVLAQEGRIVSIGYAGAPAGHPHCSSAICDITKPCTRTIHAEMNAIAFAARAGLATEGSTLYCTLSPCIECAKVILSAGVKRVLYYEHYRTSEGVVYLMNSNIEVSMYG